MANWIPHRPSGDETPIEARRFKHYVDSKEHWFCVHESLNHIGQYTVSDWASGYRVADIPCAILAARRNDTKDAARATIDQLIAKHGASRVAAILHSAPKRAA
jgi:hypothetical protein